MDGELTTGGDFLRDAVKSYFIATLSRPQMEFDGELQRGLEWSPSIIVRPTNLTTIAIEVSDDKPYPLILQIRRADLSNLDTPTTIYCVCTEESYASNQQSAKKLAADGFGLITVAADGTCHKVHHGIPFQNYISEQEFRAELRAAGIVPALQRPVIDAFDTYKTEPVSGLSKLCELVEAMIRRAGQDAGKKGFISVTAAGSDRPATILDAMHAASDLEHSRAAIGTMRGYIADARNTANHAPRTKAAAKERLRKSRIQFLDGIRNISSFHGSMKKRGLSGKAQ